MKEQIETYAKEFTKEELEKEIARKAKSGFYKNQHYICISKDEKTMILNFHQHLEDYRAFHRSSTAIATVASINSFAGFTLVKSKVIKTHADLCQLTIKNDELLKEIMI